MINIDANTIEQIHHYLLYRFIKPWGQNIVPQELKQVGNQMLALVVLSSFGDNSFQVNVCMSTIGMSTIEGKSS